MKTASPLHRLWDALTSLKLTIACLSVLMLLVVICTIRQVDLGTWGAVDRYMRSWIAWVEIPGTVLSLPLLPGGALAGLLLGVNLIAAQLRRLELSWRKAGIWIVHAGLILLVFGEFVTGMFQVETRLDFVEGQTVNYVDSPRQVELALIDTTDAQLDDVYGVPEKTLTREKDVAIEGTPITLRVHRWFQNVELSSVAPGQPGVATAGVGSRTALRELEPWADDKHVNVSAALVEPFAGGRSLGATYLVSNGLGAPQGFVHEGRTYQLAMRPRREYLPYAMTLRKFSHDVYAGTQIPKNFSSLVHLQNPNTGESRDVLIYMNQPLRYAGKAFYQASFVGETESILQVVENPGWLLPYVSCVLVTLGLLVHFGISLRRFLRRQAARGGAAAAAPAASPSPAAMEA